jgi:hypothetical protein
MPTLRELDQDFMMEVPREDGRKLQAMFRAHPEATDILLRDFCGIYRSSYVPGSDAPIAMAVRVGEQRVGLKIIRIRDAVIPEDPTPPEPPARTMTEKARRRARTPKTT